MKSDHQNKLEMLRRINNNIQDFSGENIDDRFLRLVGIEFADLIYSIPSFGERFENTRTYFSTLRNGKFPKFRTLFLDLMVRKFDEVRRWREPSFSVLRVAGIGRVTS